MHRILTLIMIAVLFFQNGMAQYYNQTEKFLKQNSVWAFGYRAGLDFSASGPKPIRTALESYDACASVADTSGHLLFYAGSQGNIYNRNHVPMENGTGLIPYYPGSAYGDIGSVVIVPLIDTPWKYFVFISTDANAYSDNTAEPPYLSYSVVDMTLGEGLGGIEPGRKNIPLYNYALHESMIAIQGENCDIWLLTLSSTDTSRANPLISPDTQQFLAWRITRYGIDTTPVTSMPYPGMTFSNSLFSTYSQTLHGYDLSVSPDRTRIALGLRVGCLLAKLDPGTGIVSEGLLLPGDDRAVSTCFSPDNSKLYTSEHNLAGTGLWPSYVMQFDISNYNLAAINSSKTVVFTTANLNAIDCYALKLYNDTIYVSPHNTFRRASYLHRINNPNASGTACNFEAQAVPILLSASTSHGLPTEVVATSADYTILSQYDTICYRREGGTSAHVLNAPNGYTEYLWDDGSTESTRNIETSGTYWVRYRNDACMNYVDTFHVTVVDLNFSLGADTTILFCDHPQSFLPLNVNIKEKDVSIRWQDGSMGSTYQVKTPGQYWAEVRKGSCVSSDTIHVEGVPFELFSFEDTAFCKGEPIHLHIDLPVLSGGTIIQWSTGSSDTFLDIMESGLYWVKLINPPCILIDSLHVKEEVCECSVYVPNAFSPNQDGINDYFKPVIEEGCMLSNYGLSIYNRFGERIFFTTNPQTGWDGTHNGRSVEMGTYFYELQLRAGSKQQKLYYKGDITLVR